jgi:hypothetical protein
MNDIKNIKEICIIGSGTYGSYIAKKLDKKNVKITIIDVGDSNIKSEKEIGYLSKILSLKYEGLNKGRFFGFGGSSSKWGGQLLFFSEKDFSNPSSFLKSIVDLNKRHKKNVLKVFGINDYKEDENFDQDFFIKHGIWLNYFKRNLFKYFKINKQKNVTIIPNSRVVELVTNDKNKIKKIVYLSDGNKYTLVADYYYLACGAFESARLLSNSGHLKKEHIKFSDHFSKKFVKVFGDPKIRNSDLTFNFSKDFSLRTTRFVGELKDKNLSYFIHPIYNSDFHFFQNFKSFLFKKSFNLQYVTNILKDLPSVLGFISYILFYKKLYIQNNTWYFQIDIEGHNEDSEFMLSKELDKFDQNGIDVNVISVKNLEASFIEIQDKIIKLLLILTTHIKSYQISMELKVILIFLKICLL